MPLKTFDEYKIAVVGLGYVGLPLAAEFGKIRPVIGFDIDKKRITALVGGFDATLELDADELAAAKNLHFSSDESDLAHCSFFIITVPTPIDAHKRPDLSPLHNASNMVGSYLKRGDIVVFESTVYPGATEEECVPILERQSGLRYNVDFFCGYSPERINPGDRAHRLPDIKKVTSGSDAETAELVDQMYKSIIRAGTYKAESIKVAEAAKVIENTQRDLNIALINELAIIFNKMGIDTQSVLEAAKTKWNFLPFSPGLVGGHCIGVDPYYLTHKAAALGYHAEVILAGRRINDNMAPYAADRMIKEMVRKSISIKGSNVLVLGLSFKENCPDIRNTKVVDLIDALEDYGVNVDCYDPVVDADAALAECGITLIADPKQKKYDGVVIAVAHADFDGLDLTNLQAIVKPDAVIFDLKSVIDRNLSDIRL
jgi:UDP-N-acetyl-D-glucosamine/UDP-N-acetyl-D-galactosamine dehydrogenase